MLKKGSRLYSLFHSRIHLNSIRVFGACPRAGKHMFLNLNCVVLSYKTFSFAWDVVLYILIKFGLLSIYFLLYIKLVERGKNNKYMLLPVFVTCFCL